MQAHDVRVLRLGRAGVRLRLRRKLSLGLRVRIRVRVRLRVRLGIGLGIGKDYETNPNPNPTPGRVLRLLQRAELALEQRLDARALASDGQAHLLASEPHAAVHHLEEGLALGLGLSG